MGRFETCVFIAPDFRVSHNSELLSRRLFLVIASVILAGCVTPPTPDLTVPTPVAWSQAPVPAAAPAELQAWWKSLHEPVLDALVSEALNNNLDIAQATRRLQKARFLARQAHAGFLPELSASVKTLQDLRTADNYLQASLDAVWELGLFGAAESTRMAANADLDGARWREQGVRVMVVADVVRTYQEIRTARYQAHLFEQMQRLDTDAQQLAQVRTQAHIGEAGEAAQISLRAAQAQAAQAQALEAADTAALSLAVLLGRDKPDPAWAAIEDETPEPGFAVREVPADLLRTRPDIHAAETEVLRAAADVGLARSALYPRVALTGAFTYSYNLTNNTKVSGNNEPGFGPQIDIPLWDWGRRRAQVRANEQELEAALLGYHKAVLSGVAEVEQALVILARQHQRGTAFEDILAAQKQRIQAQNVLGSQGLGSRFEDLGEQRALMQAQIELAAVRGAQVQAFVSLYKALGGAPLPAAGADKP